MRILGPMRGLKLGGTTWRRCACGATVGAAAAASASSSTTSSSACASAATAAGSGTPIIRFKVVMSSGRYNEQTEDRTRVIYRYCYAETIAHSAQTLKNGIQEARVATIF